MGSKNYVALHLVGSPTSEFFFDLSLLYAKNVVQPEGFTHLFAIAYPNGYWSVTAVLDTKARQLTLSEMTAKIGHADVVIPHLFCEKGLTSVRAFFEDLLNIPLVGSPGHVLGLSQHKYRTKLIAKDAGINVPDGAIVSSSDLAHAALNKLTYPLIVKPNNTDNSEGLSLVNDRKQLIQATKKALAFGNEVLIETYIAGRELRGAVLELNGSFTVLPFIEYYVSEEHPIRNPEDKLQFGQDNKLIAQSDKLKIPATCPAKLDHNLTDELSESMIRLHRSLNCRDFSMYDFRVDRQSGKPYLLETGLFWSFSEASMISGMLKAADMNLAEITRTIWQQAIRRKK